MTRELKYGRGSFPLDQAIASRAEFLSPVPPRFEGTAAELFSAILSTPVASPPLEDFVRGGRRVLLIVPDKTRLCRADLFLPLLLARIESAGVPRGGMKILVATGTHPAQSPEEIREIVGDAVSGNYTVEEHDARREEGMVLVGTTRFGTPVLLNEAAANADRIVAAGTIVHHYFAGYGGGAKMIVPGCAAYSTAVANHRRTIAPDGSFHPRCRDGVVEGNPVFEDLADMVRFFPPVFSFTLLLDESGRPVDGVCGDLTAAHREAMKKVDRHYRVPLAAPADLAIVSAGGRPKDINFIQAHKSIQHASYAVRDGGAIVCLAECADGIGNPSFVDWFRHPSAAEMSRALLERYTMNGHTALSLMNKTRRMRIILVSGLPQETVSLLGMTPAATLDEALAIAEALLSGARRTVVIENGAQCVPYLS